MHYDPFDATIRDDPYPVYQWLRDREPVYHAHPTDTFVLSRYDDVAWALGDTDLLSSDAMLAVLMGQPAGHGEQRLPRSAARGNVVSVDPPEHTEMRRIVNRGFTPRRITGWHERIDEIVSELLAEVRPGEPFDVVDGVAAVLPVRVIAEMLGADPDDAPAFRAWADSTTRIMSGSARSTGMTAEEVTSLMNLAGYLGQRIEARQREPADDLLTALVRARDDAVLDADEAVGFAALLLFAGSETTTNLIGNAARALVERPDELARTAAHPERIAGVLEETLRWESPVQHVFRRATRSFVRHGVTVPEDAIVTLVLGSANRDPRAWGDGADRFDPDRSGRTHLGFGFGTHFCLGAALARAEASITLERLIPLLVRAEVVEEPAELIDSVQFRGHRHLRFVLSAGVN